MNLDMLRRKRKADEAFDPDYEYVYGIVGTEGIYSIAELSIEFHVQRCSQ
ncbi:14805_t:CDS:1 [Funneliformis caledonium]|uniref:14805_t:CDS:1 n=1 Tax=Funneliformis caledonium TaxID=1117310 RepID=A0A9N9NA18_9GLOM|nr:14805_t:CDS:1 [Funneliformis caledonium]